MGSRRRCSDINFRNKASRLRNLDVFRPAAKPTPHACMVKGRPLSPPMAPQIWAGQEALAKARAISWAPCWLSPAKRPTPSKGPPMPGQYNIQIGRLIEKGDRDAGKLILRGEAGLMHAGRL